VGGDYFKKSLIFCKKIGILIDRGVGMINEEKLAETLRKVELSLATIHDREDGVVVGRDGRVVLHQRGEKDMVSVDGRLIKDNIFTHNHLNGMCNLSAKDVISFIADGGYETRVVTPDGRFVSLKRGDGVTNTSLGKDMEKLCTNKRFFDSVILSTIKKHGMLADISRANKELEITMNDWLSNNAVKYGYIFTQGRHKP